MRSANVADYRSDSSTMTCFHPRWRISAARYQFLWSGIFIASALIYALTLVYLTPPFQVPDEVQHYLYARAITTGTILPRDLPNHRRGGTVTQADIELIRTFSVVPNRDDHNFRITSALFRKARQVSGADVLVPANYWGSAVYSPVAYVTPAVAMLAADALGLDRLDSFYAGRAANALLFIAAVAFAIWIAPTGRPALTFIFLLPMSLYEAASFSADALTYSLSAIACALLVRIASGFSSRLVWLWVAALLIALLSTIKSPLVALVVPLIVLGWRVSSKVALLLGLAVISVWLTWTFGFALTDAFGARQKPLPGVSASDQMHFLLTQPLSIFTTAFQTLLRNTPEYVISGIGYLGWLDAPLALWFYLLALASGLAAFVCSAVSEPFKSAPGFRLALAAAALIAIALTFGTLYLAWTPVGASVVEGVQGRYFIPILAILVLSFSGLRPPPTSTTELLMAVALLFFSAISFGHVSKILLYRYYIT
jgi:uncharacterized membrane protein